MQISTLKCLVLVVFVISLFIFGYEASAHATPVAYEPENSAIVEKAPERIKIHYSERVDLGASSIEVFGPDGTRIDNNDASVALNDPRLFEATIKDRGEGTYTISWKVLSADDGHFSKGAFIFSVGKETGAGVAGADQFQVVYRSNLGEAVTIFIELLGQALLIGLFVLHFLVFSPLKKRGLLGDLSKYQEDYERRFSLLVIISLALILIGTISYITVKSIDLKNFQNLDFNVAVKSFSTTMAGSYTLYRAIFAIIFLAIFSIFKRKLFGEKIHPSVFALFTLVILLALARARVSHAAASHFYPSLSVFVTFLQILFKMFWVGGVLATILIYLPFLNRPGKPIGTMSFFTGLSRLISIAFGFVGVSGAYMVWLDLKTPENLLTSDWGIRFITLGVIGGFLFLLRMFHQLVVDRLGVVACRGPNPVLPAKVFRWFPYTFILEGMVGIILLFVTSFLIITTPPVTRPELLEKTAVSQGAIVQFQEHRYESDYFLISVIDERSDEPISLKDMTITLFNDEKGIGPIVAETEKRFEGGYAFKKSSLSPPGKWKIEVAALRKGSYDSVVDFQIDYPSEIDAVRGDKGPKSRSFGMFEILNIVLGIGILGFSFLLYRISQKFYEACVEIQNASTNTALSASFAYGSYKKLLVPVIVASVFGLALWQVHTNVLKSSFQKRCEADGNAWHQMVPIRNNKVVSQISQKGCMAFNGAYLFADEREYEYFFEPTSAEVFLETKPEDIYAGIPIDLTLSIKDKDGNPAQDLTVSHERIIHTIVVSEDFSIFSHIHPENAGPITTEMKKSARFPLTYTFPKAGRYIISVDFTVKSQNFPKQFIVDVKGAPAMAVQKKETSWQKKFGDYSVEFSTSPSGPVEAGKSVVLRYAIRKNGVPVQNLVPYLGAAAHLAIVRSDLGKFVHTHGEVHPPGAPPTPINTVTHFHPAPPKIFGPDVEAHVIFPEPGLYQVFGEFQHEDKAVVIDFMVKVE